MNKADLIEALTPALGGRAEASLAVETIVDVVLREVAGGGSVGITGFGTFEGVRRAPRTGRNPRTGEAVPIPGTTAPRFRPGAYFKDVVADPSRLPAEGLAGVRVGSHAEATGEATGLRRSATGTGAKSGATTRAAARPSTEKATTGKPSSVRRTAAEKASAAPTSTADAGTTAPELPLGDGGVDAGESISMTVIKEKKRQLARAKDDSKGGKKNKKKDKSKDKDKAKKKDKKKGKKKSKKD